MSAEIASLPAPGEGRPAGSPLEAPPDVLVAIALAVEECWPRASASEPAPRRTTPSAWRFSGRWWARPEALRRERP